MKVKNLNLLDLSNQKGFTLTELLVAMGLSLIVLGAGYTIFRVQAHTAKAQEFKMEAQEYGRAALDMMVREIRNTGFFLSGVACVPGPVVAASATSFRFVYDVNGNGLCNDTAGTVGADEDVTYDLTAGDIRRAVNNGIPQPITSGTGNVGLQFIYYPVQTGAAPPPPYCYGAAPGIVNGVVCSGNVTVNLANIKRISIILTVQSRSTDSQFNGSQFNGGLPQTITMNSDVDLRNRCFPSCG